MPQAFENCIKNGGKVRAKKLKGNKYLRICFLKGKSYAGEVKISHSNEQKKMADKMGVNLN